eukprot:TRINITY_DN36842_c0_g2_i1.p1 TRINITY_DN36842_c0_g2~~TRINITY_DN36842_c0_g2_i1.p1  ORF type:complete len:710 (+),score=118.49 TRINITY_DN36842_c0_g2_i1:196-2325(+)
MLGTVLKSLFSVCTEIHSGRSPEKLEDEEEAEVVKGQDHVFNFYEQLTDAERKELDDDYDSLDFEDAETAFVAARAAAMTGLKHASIEAPNVLNWDLKRSPTAVNGANVTMLADIKKVKLAAWQAGGFELYNRQRVAVVIMTGGLDSDMNIAGLPIGALDFGLLSHKSIFQLYIERIRRLKHLAHRKFKRILCIPLYIMCNRQNRNAIEYFFRDNSFFGMREQDFLFFTQADVPVFNEKGKALLTGKSQICKIPNGSGGIFKSLVEEGMVSDMKSRGVTTLYVCSVDNVLTKIGDPVFLGYVDSCRCDIGLKCTERMHPDEELGAFCTQMKSKMSDVDGDGGTDMLVCKARAAVVDNFDIPEDLKRRRQGLNQGATASLVLRSGNMSQYVFKVDFAMRVHVQTPKRWHYLKRNVDHIDVDTGETVQAPPHVMNARKIEMRISDSFELVSRVCGLQVPRTEMARIKRPTGEDCPATALQQIGKLHQKWILDAGGTFASRKMVTDRDDAKCEISPLVSYEGEDLTGQFPHPVELPYYLPSQQELLNFSAASTSETRRQSFHYVDWESPVSQVELEAEIQGRLGHIMTLIKDTQRKDYTCERAEEEYVLPATPRHSQKWKSSEHVPGPAHVADATGSSVSLPNDGGENSASVSPATRPSLESSTRESSRPQPKRDASGLGGAASSSSASKKKASTVSGIVENKRAEFWGPPS